MTDLDIRIDRRHDSDVTIVRLSGALTLRARPRIRATVLRCLAEQPTAVILDCAGLAPVDSRASAVFLALHHEASREPTVPLLLSAVPDEVGDSLRHLAAQLPLFPSSRAAVAAVTSKPAVRWMRRTFPVGPEVPSLIGCLIADLCAWWDLIGLIHPARSVTFELVRATLARACQSGDLDITVTLRDPQLQISVRATGAVPGVARRRPPPRLPHAVGWGMLRGQAGFGYWAIVRVPG